MPNKMLIDASHPEETRVVVTRGNRLEEFDFESQDKKQLKGNIYLARVTRVEPSLQAAFVEYGGNRHGFLAFNEIHPDYYQIPVADRQALVQAEAEEARAEEDENDDGDERGERSRGHKRRRGRSGRRDNGSDEAPASAASADGETTSEEAPAARRSADEHNGNGSDEDDVDTVGAEDALDEVRNRRKPVRRDYKIQEVIKRRQILLVQVVKEERGNKGAALTTYLSLAGRYSVLMPNTARGGGISRKIASPQDRKRLKEVVRDLEVPEGMGVILRTAGANRTKAEVKRDYEYLMRLWEKVRGLTLESTAPALVYEEGSLIKRSVRDLYNKDIGEILVAGDDGYREAKEFMRMLMPSHAKSVQPYRDSVPIFARNGIEAQLDRMVQPQVTLKSGGYVIINQTEALVAIDVNSGRSTKEHSIEDTALQTNLEAAEEVARQLRLRDLAGLIVIDFIDMEENRNNRAVEKKLKECLKNDRARIQVGRVSHFGLLEMSRQRIRASVLESTMQPCPHCGGTGHVRSESSVALLVVRAIEEYLLKDSRNHITVRTPPSTALYVLNHKRGNLMDLEGRFGVDIAVEADETLGSQHYSIVKGPPSERTGTLDHTALQDALSESDDADDEQAETAEAEESSSDEESGREGKRRRRRRRRGGRDRTSGDQVLDDNVAAEAGEPSQEARGEDESASGDDENGERKKRRRGKRGGKRNRRDGSADDGADVAAATGDGADEGAAEPAAAPAPSDGEGKAEDDAKPARKPRRRSAKKTDAEPDAAAEGNAAEQSAQVPDAPAAEAPAEQSAGVPDAPEAEAPAEQSATDGNGQAASEEAPKAKKPRRRRAAAKQTTEEPADSSSESSPAEAPRRTGWWQKKGFF